jgi:hypothetical protein
MDTLKDKDLLDSLADTEVPPWAVWLKDTKVAQTTAAEHSIVPT